MRRLILWLSGIFVLLSCSRPACAQTTEYRALWVDAFNAGFKSTNEVRTLVAEARAGRFNTLMVEVRKRGDAYYDSRFEPRAADIPSGFDPLACLIAEAHQGTPRLEVHAWIVTYPIWNRATSSPAQLNHPFNLHPDWLGRNVSGETFDGSNFTFDPGHPEVQRHTFNVGMDLIARYDIDALQLDYVRFPGNSWGYNPVSVERFNQRFGRAGTPGPDDETWKQFRRDQVTALVRKLYLNAMAIRPGVKITAATIASTPSAQTLADWPATSAYANVLQDWRAWMEEGILDLNLPMAYFRQPANGTDWARWSQFIKDHRYGRHAAPGAGWYLNSISNNIYQLRSTRQATASGNSANGMAGYSYAATCTNGTRAQFFAALTTRTAHDSSATPVFSTIATPPDMPWKIQPTLAHVMGYVLDDTTGEALDGATLALAGPVQRTMESDATGFFGAAHLPPGEYTVTAHFDGLEDAVVSAALSAGKVSSNTFRLKRSPGDAFHQLVRSTPGMNSAAFTWTTTAPALSRVIVENDTSASIASPEEWTNTLEHSAIVTGLTTNTTYRFALRSNTGANVLQSSWSQMRTAGAIIIDNPQAVLMGGWTVGTASTDKYGTNYHYKTTVATDTGAYALFAPTIATPGLYDVYAWYAQGANRTTGAVYQVKSDGGLNTVRLNQTTGGGRWRLLASARSFARGCNGYVKLLNNTGDTGKVVVADAVMFVYAPTQETGSVHTPPAWWTDHYFKHSVAGDADEDGDGYSNFDEYVLGTDPLDALSQIRLKTEVLSTGSIVLEWAPAHVGRSYFLLKNDALDPAEWLADTNAAVSIDTQGVGRHTNASSMEPQRFYRLGAQ